VDLRSLATLAIKCYVRFSTVMHLRDNVDEIFCIAARVCLSPIPKPPSFEYDRAYRSIALNPVAMEPRIIEDLVGVLSASEELPASLISGIATLNLRCYI